VCKRHRSVMYAELLDMDIDSLVVETVTRHMIHVPCDTARSIILRSFMIILLLKKMILLDRRMDDGRSITVHGKRINTRWVILYNRDLSVMHILSILISTCIRNLIGQPLLLKMMLKMHKMEYFLIIMKLLMRLNST